MSERTYKVKLIANVKYDSKRYSQGDSIEVTADEYLNLKESELINDEFTETKESEPNSFNDMTISELNEYAEENKIDLGKATKKSDIVAIISESLKGD